MMNGFKWTSDSVIEIRDDQLNAKCELDNKVNKKKQPVKAKVIYKDDEEPIMAYISRNGNYFYLA